MTLLRLGSHRLGQIYSNSVISNIKSLCGSQINKISHEQRATVVGVSRIDPEDLANKPKPWPYKTKKWTYFHRLFNIDPTHEHYDENSKIVVVEGNKSCGKEEFVKRLAEEFGWLHMPEITLDELYINGVNFDYRSLNEHLSEVSQAIDEKMWYQNPHHKAAPWMMYWFFWQRYFQYIDALAHFYNTGQGVILERSPWSHFVFTEAMYKNGFLQKDARDFLRRQRHDSIYWIQRPHLVIYLDVPAEVLLERIRKRNRPHEVHSKVFKNADYLKEVEYQYKKEFLPILSHHSEVLTYDWTNEGDIEEIIEDIERIDFENYDHHYDKMSDWNLWSHDHWEMNRVLYTNKKDWIADKGPDKQSLMGLSFTIPDDQVEHRNRVFDNLAKGHNRIPSFDENVHGMSKVFFKILPDSYRESIDFFLRSPYN